MITALLLFLIIGSVTHMGRYLSCYVKRKQFVVKKWLILKNVILCNKGDNVVAYISQTVIH